LASCQGTGCENYTLPLVQSDMFATVITVASTSGTTYTWKEIGQKEGDDRNPP